MYVGSQVGSLVDLQLVNRAGAKGTASRCLDSVRRFATLPA